jgi:hypothetical protein
MIASISSRVDILLEGSRDGDRHVLGLDLEYAQNTQGSSQEKSW